MHRHVRRTFASTGTTALLAAALLTAPGAQAAAATTCQGKEVTIDGTGQATVTGTPANDVIAAGQGSSVSALAGDDTICVLPSTATTPTSVDAGEGNDSVDTSTLAAGVTVTTTLGAGDDTYAGGAASDQVATREGADTVSTGAGNDGVGSGIAAQPNGDKLDLGVGDDVLDWHGIQAPGGSVDLGEGANTLADSDGGVVAINAVPRKLDRNAVTALQWKGTVTTYVVESTATSAAFTGTNDAETFILRDPAAGATPTKVAVDMAGGNDTVTIRSNVIDGSSWAGGDGTDLFQVAHNYGELLINLNSGQFETGAPDVTVDQTVRTFENVDAVTTSMTVKGTHQANVINVEGCDVRLAGRAGDDKLAFGTDIENAPSVTCSTTTMTARGGKNDDEITGTNGADKLFGNRGRDSIDALAGNDVIFGGDDTDRVNGNAGDDKVRGGRGNDEVGGNDGNDRVQGDQGNDRLLGQAGNDVLVGGRGFDRANGADGFDKCFAVERRRNCER
ncbi:calcium-binding protein [Nocardioides allogilvus]|uniref:calcium-binding protein n=1 Tax=Nocardioides allogilvus TaxID=2072017 RepID=UPI000D2F9D73|nr:calcium-binding protein [Nocardioides allogilvus]